MSKKIQLSIPTPCHEDWNNMTPVEKGKFCGSCQKQVVDFSRMSDREVAQFFKKPSTGSVCGRFMSDQLERDIEIPKKRIPWLKYFFQVALPAFFMSKAVSAQEGTGKAKLIEKDTVRVPLDREFRTLGMVAPRILPTDTVSIPVKPIEVKGEKGMVVDAATGKPLDGAWVTMYSTIGKEKYVTDKKGVFVLNTLPKVGIDHIEIDHPGFQAKTLTFDQFLKLGRANRLVKLERSRMIVGDTIAVQPPDGIVAGNLRIDIVKDTMLVPVCQKPVEDTVVSVAGFVVKKVVNPVAVKGKVVDEKGDVLPGVFVRIKENRTGVAADSKGKFTLTAAIGQTLIASGPGVDATELLITNTKPVIVLQRAFLGEVSITKQKKNPKETPLMKPVAPDPNAGSFRTYPNPVAKGAALTIEWKQKEEGYFKLQFLNQSAQAVHEEEVWIDAEARVLNVQVPSVTPGIYYLVLTSKNTWKRFTEKIVVSQ